MDFKQLQTFVSVVRHQSFTKAAEELFLTQPTVSLQIRQLEAELQTTLLLRTTKSFQVTPEGRELFRYASSILELRSKIYQNCAHAEGTVFHIGASTIPAVHLLPEILTEFSKKHPGAGFEIHQSNSDEITENVINGVYDIGFVGKSIRDAQLYVSPLIEDRIVFATPAAEPYLSLKQSGEDPVPALLDAPFILRESGSGSLNSALPLLAAANRTETSLKVAARTNNTDTIKQLVKGGVGITLISSLAIAEELAAGKLLCFDPGTETAARTINMIVRKDRSRFAYIADFMKIAAGKA